MCIRVSVLRLSDKEEEERHTIVGNPSAGLLHRRARAAPSASTGWERISAKL